MTPPRKVSNTSSTPATPSPAHTEAQNRLRQAGFARNRAEASYNAAVKEHGKESAQAKAAKAPLDAAQAEVEAAQKAIREASNKAPSSAVAKPHVPKQQAKDVLKTDTVKVETTFIELTQDPLPKRYLEIIRRPANSQLKRSMKIFDEITREKLKKMLEDFQKGGGSLKHFHGEESLKLPQTHSLPTPPAS